MSDLADTNKTLPTERIGVWICDCGGRISETLDTTGLREHAAATPNVIYATREAYPCSKAGQERLRQAITDYHLDRILIAGCAPRLIEKLFLNAASPTGLDAAYIEITNVREQCALAHPNQPALATKKAANLIDMGIARLLEVQTQPHSKHPILPAVAIIGSGLGGMALALTLAERGIEVSLVEPTNRLGGSLLAVQGQAGELATEMAAAVSNHPCIRTFLNRSVTDISGQPGSYRVSAGRDDSQVDLVCGAIVLAGDAQPEPLDSEHYYDHRRVQTQAEFGIEMERVIRSDGNLGSRQIVMILQAEGQGEQVCCAAAIRQAVRVRQLDPSAQIAVLFHDLPLSEAAKSELLQAHRLGVQFYRYSTKRLPEITSKTVEVFDTLSQQTTSLPYDRIVLSTPLTSQTGAKSLAALLHLPQDERGFLMEPRSRLRPERSRANGVFIVGGSHLPAETSETLFQAYLVGARVFNFLQKQQLSINSPVARIDPMVCTGCGSCMQVCPTNAIRLEKRAGILSLSQVEDLNCIGCGSCIVACPVKAISLSGWEDQTILAEIDAALQVNGWSEPAGGVSQPLILAFTCEWSAYAAADMAGMHGCTYPPSVRVIRLNCSTRFDPNFALWALLNGADGVFIGACEPGECHYGSGNRFAEERAHALKEQLAAYGIDPARLKFAFLSGDDGERFAALMNQFAGELSLRQRKTSTTSAASQRNHEREPAIGFGK